MKIFSERRIELCRTEFVKYVGVLIMTLVTILIMVCAGGLMILTSYVVIVR